jgi:hypothetical protein
MSGRSAYVRKEKTKIKDGAPIPREIDNSERSVSLTDFPVPGQSPQYYPQQTFSMIHPADHATVRSGGSGGSEERGYARVQKPILPDLTESGIEKSSFRSLIDKKSEGVRKGLAKTFGGKKKKDDDRPPTSATVRATDPYELDGQNYVTPGSYTTSQTGYSKSRLMMPPDLEYVRSGPPQGKLPPLPRGPQMRRWIGGGRPSQPWNKLRKDPELWDPNGDTLIYFGRNDDMYPKPSPSFRISSHMIERTESRHLITLLRHGSTEERGHGNFSMPPSPLGSPGTRSPYPNHHGPRQYQQTPPVSDSGSRGGFEGQISYELFFEPPHEMSSSDIIRYQLTIRNVFAVLLCTSLAGYNFYHTLCDVQEQLEEWLPSGKDNGGVVIDYLIGKGFDDVRDNLSVATSILAWSERRSVCWTEGWTESFVHCCGMYNRLENCPEFRFVSTIARALLERSALEMQVRIHEVEQRLNNFDFSDMWPKMSHSSAARESFELAREFFLAYYKGVEGRWPPLIPATEEQWLSRTWAQRLQTDFGALYDILVDRSVVWDGSEERSGRKWNIVKKGNHGFEPDTPDLPFTDILVAFDNRLAFPHIPRPYCRVPDPIPDKKPIGDNGKSSKKTKAPEDKMALKKAQLAYTNSTNIFALGTDYIKNDMVEEFIKFERHNYGIHVDSYAARRGRWVLIYGILQVLASVSVDSPNLRYKEGIHYHLSAQLRGTPPWAGLGNGNEEEADPTHSYCWTVLDSWEPKLPVTRSKPIQRGDPIQVHTRIPQIPHIPMMVSPASVSATTSPSDTEAPTPSLKSPVSIQSLRMKMSPKPRQRPTRDSDKGSPQPIDPRNGDLRDQSGNVANSNAPRMPERGDNAGNVNTSSSTTQRRERNETFGSNNYNLQGQEREEALGSSNSYRRVRERNEPAGSNATSRAHSRAEAVSDHNFSSRNDLSNTGYAPGIERVDEWPIRDQSRTRKALPQPRVDLNLGKVFGTKDSSNFTIKDFDEYEF